MSSRRIVATVALVVFCLVCFTGAVFAVESPSSDSSPAPAQSPYLIVEFDAPPLAAVYRTQLQAASANGRLDVNEASAQAYVAELRAQQAAFVSQMQTVLPNATVGEFYADGALQQKEALTYQVVFNGMAVNPGTSNFEAAARQLAAMPGVKAVYPDSPNYTQLYTSTQLINAPVVWDVLGGRENAGAGVKFASVDGGVHHLAPMFSGEGYDYPPGYGPFGLGMTNNNNGKIIVSRAYFREWDPPQVEDLGLPQTQCGDACAWPGPRGTSHGVHTASTAAGNVVSATFSGFDVGTISGVAPRAYVMSYKVFYGSVDEDGSFWNAEGIAALEDVATDGADVLNNSWGGGPTSAGGPGDPLDTALVNLAASGVFVSMSAGNAGPSFATQDHPSSDYINVAATTTSGTLASGRIRVPGQEDLQAIPFAAASFGATLPPVGTVITYPVLPSANVDPANVQGCNAWPAGTFEGRAALIQRGTCEFGVKVLNAEQAGADFVIVYNNPAGGDELISMGPGAVGDQVTIGSVFIGNTAGQAIVDAYTSDPNTVVVLDMQVFQAGNVPDRVANFSSRGAGVGNVLKPDIAAPGVNILAQGYDPDAEGEAAHLGFGQASGTSMASPHVAGAAILVRQAYPTWPVSAIKSALMSTSKYMDIYNADGVTPAQPLDIGAGRLDLTRVLDPGVILDPPSLSFGTVQSGTLDSIMVTVTSVATQTETYQLSTLYVGGGFTATTALPGFSVSSPSITLEPGQSAQVTVTVNSAATPGVGDSQGYIIMDGTLHDAHMPAWARITPATPIADVLIIDNDASDLDPSFGDYLGVYTRTVEALGLSYGVVNTADRFGETTTIPSAAELLGYDAVLWFTGDNYLPVAGLTDQDQFTLLEYLNNGGKVIAMGQDLASSIDAVTEGVTPPPLYAFGFGAEWLQDSISNYEVPGGFATSASDVPEIFRNLVVRLTQVYVDEVQPVPNPVGNDDYGRAAREVLNYGGPFNIEDGTVALIHRDQPSLELPEIPYLGKAFYATFGLEGMEVLTVTEEFTTTTPVELLGTVFAWADSEAGAATISNTTPVSVTGITLFTANYTSPEGDEATDWRWDFGDGSPLVVSESEAAGHTYACSDNNIVTVRVEITDEAGNRSIGSLQADVSATCFEETRGFFLPFTPQQSATTTP